MRKNWLLLGIGLVVAVLAVAAVACSDDDDDDNGGGDGATTLSASLSEVDGNGVTGSATLTEADGTTEVVVEMAGLDGTHANHLHHGDCDAQGEVHVTLTELEADADGDATATTSGFPSDPEDPGIDHFAAGHYAAVHEAGGAPGPVISCGDVS